MSIKGVLGRICTCTHADSNHHPLSRKCFICDCDSFTLEAGLVTQNQAANDTPTRFTEIVPIEHSWGIPQMGPAVGMINIDTIVAFQVPKWGSSQGPTPFVAITGERGHVKMAYIELYALFADKASWHETKDKWLERSQPALPEPKTNHTPGQELGRGNRVIEGSIEEKAWPEMETPVRRVPRLK